MTAVAVGSVPPAAMAGLGLGGTSGRPALTLSWAELADYAREAARSGGCTRPVRVKGRVDAIDLATGERRAMYDTATEPGGVRLMPCGNRRESVCPPCSQVYKQDARQLVRAGLTGGKGVPETVAGHPCVFATFTAPSFGPVHSRRMRGKTLLPCRPRRDHKERRCPHGRDISCPRRHSEDDPGSAGRSAPNAMTMRLPSSSTLMRASCGAGSPPTSPAIWPAGLASPSRQLRALVRVRYVKVAEYQERGVVHFHAVIRLDAPGEDYQPPAERFTADLLTGAIRDAAAAVRLVQGPDEHRPDCPVLVLRFGTQVDPRPVRPTADGLPGTGRKLSVDAVANYIAKYATKSLTDPGLPSRPIRSRLDIDSLRCSRHYKQMIAAAWRLGARRATGNPRLRRLPTRSAGAVTS